MILIPFYRIIASPINYAQVTDENLHKGMILTGVLCTLLSVIGVFGWIRYKRNYQHQPGHYRPLTVLLIVVLLIVILAFYGLSVIYK